MNHKLSTLKKYKHDTIGKFQNIKELIEYINDENIHDEETKEILQEVHNIFLKMAASTEKLKNEYLNN